ncbi:MAG: acylphosphatase [Halobacteria archaeon]
MTGPAQTRAHLYIRGDVQGVGFRHFILRVAGRAGVAGWVRNLEDGRVEAVAEGPEAAVKQWVEGCRKGPPFAQVEGVEVAWEAPEGKFKEFEIVR